MTKVSPGVYISDDCGVYKNQALELWLFENAPDSGVVLYIWCNDKTVVIGRNQDAFTEARVDLLVKEGGLVARRLSGGGAVYHDKGNLNFTFISKDSYDVMRQLNVVAAALYKIGIRCVISGRNDLEVNGKKISGNAFYKKNGVFLHHGTVLINADTAAVERYLTPHAKKLSKRNVSSISARIGNLNEVTASANKDTLIAALKEAFSAEYKIFGEAASRFGDTEEINRKAKFFSDANWIYGKDEFYNFRTVKHLSRGLFDIRALIEDDIYKKVKIYSDALDADTVESETGYLIGRNVAEATGEIADIVRGSLWTTT